MRTRLNMAFVMPFVGYGVYLAIARRAPLHVAAPGGRGRHRRRTSVSTRRRWLAAVEFGIQPLLFHTADGTPLYAPFHLSQTIPAMALAHLTVAGGGRVRVDDRRRHVPAAREPPAPAHQSPGDAQIAATTETARAAPASARRSARLRGRRPAHAARTARARERVRRGRARRPRSAQVPPAGGARTGLARYAGFWHHALFARVRLQPRRPSGGRLHRLGLRRDGGDRGRRLRVVALARIVARRDRPLDDDPRLADRARDPLRPVRVLRPAREGRLRREDDRRSRAGCCARRCSPPTSRARTGSCSARMRGSRSSIGRRAPRWWRRSPGTSRCSSGSTRRRVLAASASQVPARFLVRRVWLLRAALHRGRRAARHAQLHHARPHRRTARHVVRHARRPHRARTDRRGAHRHARRDVDLARRAPHDHDALAAAPGRAARAARAARVRPGARHSRTGTSSTS